MDKRLNRLIGVQVDGLFGRSGSFNIGLDPMCTVLTGGNGTGKSTLLRLIWAVAAAQFQPLRTAPLDRLVLSFTTIPDFVVDNTGNTTQLQWGENKAELTTPPILESLEPWARAALEEANFDGDRAAEFLYEFMPHDIQPSEMVEIRQTLREITPSDVQISQPPWYPGLQAAFPVAFITDQRLLIEESRRRVTSRRYIPRPRAGRISRAVEGVSADISERITRADMQYARASQRIDREFPQQVMADLKQPVPDRDSVATLSREVDSQRERLRQTGLIDRDVYYDVALDLSSEDAHILTVVASFLRSTQQKLAELSDLADRLTTFKDFIDSMFAGKLAIFTRDEGLGFQVGERRIAAHQLSSGEQQMVVLAHKILFETEPGTLVIIDEPEISLHIRWQDRLLSDLISMGEQSSLHYLMATHSPMVLANHPQAERSLDDLSE